SRPGAPPPSRRRRIPAGRRRGKGRTPGWVGGSWSWAKHNGAPPGGTSRPDPCRGIAHELPRQTLDPGEVAKRGFFPEIGPPPPMFPGPPTRSSRGWERTRRNEDGWPRLVRDG